MQRIIYGMLTVILLVALAACGGSSGTNNTGNGNGGTSDTGSQSQSGGPTPTKIVLATPTPRPAPPTPTPKPKPTMAPTEEPTATTAAADSGGEMATAAPEATAAMPEPAAPMLETEMVMVPAGPFTMGSDDGDPEDAPAHTVDLPAFEIDKFEVTNDDFALFVDATGYQTYAEVQGASQNWRNYAEGKGNHPVVKVTWNDAAAFCEWAGKRLPTEEEWEKAARGDDGRAYPWGNEFDPAKANVKDTGIRGTTAVGSFGAGASPYGVEDIAGNVWEWTASWFKAYPGSTTDNPYFGEKFRVTRGGAWFEEAPQVTTFNRNAADPEITANDDLGFRCVRDAQ